MLTPQEVKSHAFQRASFSGYNMGQVDEFLDILTEDYTALYNDNGTECVLSAGDVMICPAGTGHAVANNGEETLELCAVIVYA